MGQGEMEEEEGKSEAPLTLPHGCFATPAIHLMFGRFWLPRLFVRPVFFARLFSSRIWQQWPRLKPEAILGPKGPKP